MVYKYQPGLSSSEKKILRRWGKWDADDWKEERRKIGLKNKKKK